MTLPRLALLLAASLAARPADGALPAARCRAAATAAEQRWSLPANLLLAIGEVESGRRDGGRMEPWPWSADVAGQDYVFASLPEAVTVVGFLQERGIRSIDVGCFQVNLHYHPGAFASVAQGFDPETNADYAAAFLRRLFARSGSWAAAVAGYHSADPALGEAYRARVLLAWRALGGSVSAAAQAGAPPPPGDPYVILAAAAAAGIPVYTLQNLPAPYRVMLGLGSTPSRAKK